MKTKNNFANYLAQKKPNQIYHDHCVKNFLGLEKIVEKYLND